MFAILSLILLAGQALALNVTLGTQVIEAREMVNFTPQGPIAVCAQDCSLAQTAIEACGTNDSCLCSNDTAALLLTCQQCMFTGLIAANQKMPDIRAGSQPLLGAYAAACAAQANVTFTAPQTALALPAFWDGPTGIAVPIGALVVIVGAGGMMGFGFIYMLSNM